MTIAVAIRLESAVIFAADSKVTTSGVVGYEENGAPRWVEQTYDSATKVVHDRRKNLMAMVAGSSNIGTIAGTDFISTQDFGLSVDRDGEIAQLVGAMVERKKAYWETTKVPPENWPGPTMFLAAPSPNQNVPRVWRIRLEGAGSTCDEILTEPGIRFEGSYAEVWALLYGFDLRVMRGIRERLGIEDDVVWKAVQEMKVLRPIDKLTLWGMPIQDAIDLAYFLANVQVEMDRFLPGTPACGGPIDVMVLQLAPEPGIVSYPGKVLHHPRERARVE